MNIELAIAQLTEAVKENTAALQEILKVGSITAAETLTPAAPKKPKSEQKAPLTVVEEPAAAEPAAAEPAAAEPEPEATEPEPEATESAPEVPDLSIDKLRESLKEVIKGKLFDDKEGKVKPTFDALRAKYGVTIVKNLTDEQVRPFYAEVLGWQ